MRESCRQDNLLKTKPYSFIGINASIKKISLVTLRSFWKKLQLERNFTQNTPESRSRERDRPEENN